MDLNIFFNIALAIALISDLGMLILAVFKKRFSRKFLINFFLFSIYVAAIRLFASYMIKHFGIQDTSNYLLISIFLFAITIAFLKYSMYLIKEEKEHLL